jgi:hypothetical protein
VSIGWWEPIVSIAVIVILILSQWRPATGTTVPDRPSARELDAIVAQLAAPDVPAADLDRRLTSWSRFPPRADASRALAESLSACRVSTLDEGTRRRLALQLFRLYAITPEDDSATSVSAVTAIGDTVNRDVCPPGVMDALLRAAGSLARRDPQGRRDWW